MNEAIENEAIERLIKVGFKKEDLVELIDSEIMHLEFLRINKFKLVAETINSENIYILFGLENGYISEDFVNQIRNKLSDEDKLTLDKIMDYYHQYYFPVNNSSAENSDLEDVVCIDPFELSSLSDSILDIFELSSTDDDPFELSDSSDPYVNNDPIWGKIPVWT